jgi:hypothetical protein
LASSYRIIANMILSNISSSRRAPVRASKTAETHTGTTTSWLSMITSPPIDRRCQDHLYSPESEDVTLVAFDPNLETAANMTCLPQEAVEWYTQRRLPFGATTGIVTSLGPMICPNAYTTASTSKKDDISTMVFCCPSEYDFATSAGPGALYGCTSQQTQAVTVHSGGATGAIRKLAAGSRSRARNIAGIAVNGWIFKPSHTSTSARPSETFTGDVWARKHLGMTTAEFSGIILAVFVVLLLFPLLIYCLVKRMQRDLKTTSDEEGTHSAGNGTRNFSIRPDQMDFNPAQDVELSDLDSSGTRVSSSAGTVVRHSERSEQHSERKTEGSSTIDGDDRTA